jgi:hypothetical protein
MVEVGQRDDIAMRGEPLGHVAKGRTNPEGVHVHHDGRRGCVVSWVKDVGVERTLVGLEIDSVLIHQGILTKESGIRNQDSEGVRSQGVEAILIPLIQEESV